jgi:hypothetical protein
MTFMDYVNPANSDIGSFKASAHDVEYPQIHLGQRGFEQVLTLSDFVTLPLVEELPRDRVSVLKIRTTKLQLRQFLIAHIYSQE